MNHEGVRVEAGERILIGFDRTTAGECTDEVPFDATSIWTEKTTFFERSL